jgi:hypothetical protein
VNAIRPSTGLTIALLALALTLGLCAGCDDDPASPPTGSDLDRSSPEKLVEDWLEKVYSGKDASHYAEALHPDYRFEFLQEDAEILQSLGYLAPGQTWWSHDAEQACSGNLFASPNVGNISLNVTVDHSETDATCADCVRLQTSIDLRVTTNPGGPEPLTLVVNSPQDFLVTKDPSDATKWVILRQNDRPRVGGKSFSGGQGALIPATENTSWGLVKGLYAESPAAYGGRSTPEQLLTEWFEIAYSGENAIDYRKMLHPEFRFEFLLEDAEVLQAQGVLPPGATSWGHGADYTSTEAMFETSYVSAIALNITIDSDTPDTACADCRIVETFVDLLVTTASDPQDPIVLVVLSPQTFILKRDPTDPSQWTIRRQIDKLRDGGPAFPGAPGVLIPGATENTSWGQIKGIFAQSP